MPAPKEQGPIRPKFVPSFPDPVSVLAQTDDPAWISVVESDAYFNLESFLSTLEQLCLHPERNSSSILRADILHDTESSSGSCQDSDGRPLAFRCPPRMKERRKLRRKLLPRKPNIDRPLEQDCLFLVDQDPLAQRGMVVLLPDVREEKDVPFYHPILRKLAFEYRSSSTFQDGADPNTTPRGKIRISALPFASSANIEINPIQAALSARAETREVVNKLLPQRTIRTCMHLLETLYKHAWGAERGYEKRVIHDVLVIRENFQDLYLVLKERHKHLDSRKQRAGYNRVEDVKRHVWKDVAVACFLMLLWKDTYPSIEPEQGLEDVPPTRPWDRWGRPPGGFLDLGCGNALLVHILITEGYKGKGIELRERRTWPTYPAETRAALIEQAIEPPLWFPNKLDEWIIGDWDGRDQCPIEEGMFLIGNHADEMTPWLPLLSLIPKTPSPFLSLPCCLHTLNGPFTLSKFVPPEPHAHMPPADFEEGLEQGESRYKAYLKWLGWMGLKSGWIWEKEPLRVPSTKSWGIVARKRWTTTAEEDNEAREYAFQLVSGVRQGGGFVVRDKEGNPDGH